MITEIKTCLVLKCTLCNLLNYLSTISSYNHKISLISVQINKTCVYTGKSKRLHLVKRALFLSPVYQAHKLTMDIVRQCKVYCIVLKSLERD